MIEEGISVLIPSGAGAPGFAGISACLREDARIRVVSGDINNEAYGKSLSDAFYKMPPAEHPDYIRRVKEICDLEKIKVVLPITTRELNILSRERQTFEDAGIKVIVSPEIGLNLSNDKGKLHNWAAEIGIPIPEGGVCANKVEFERLANDLLSRHEYLFFKPTVGNGSRGIGLIAKNVKSNMSNGKPELMPLLLSEWTLRLPDQFDTPLLLTQFLPGKEYSVDAFVWPGNETIIIPRSRDKMVSGISVSGEFEKNENLISQTHKLLKSLDLLGPIGIQWRNDENGMAHLLEINPRLQGTTSALRHAGINVPLLAINRALNMEYTTSGNIHWNRGFTRYWQDVFL